MSEPEGVQLPQSDPVEQRDSWSIRGVAQRTGMSPSEVSRILALTPKIHVPAGKVLSRDGKLRPQTRTDTTARDSEIRTMRARGDSIRKIAAAIDVSVGTVHRVIKDAGL